LSLWSRVEMKIHKTALVNPDAQISEDVEIGPYSIIGPDVKIGARTKINARVIIEGHTQLGEDCEIGIGTIIGNPPQDLKYKGEKTEVIIGNKNVIREYVTINRATGEGGVTRLGDDNLIMSYVHIAHNCTIGNKTILSNMTTLAGHIVIEDKAVIGGLVPIHQFVNIGTLSMIGGISRVAKDIPPYCLAAGNPIRLYGLNVVGLRRQGISDEKVSMLKMVYKIFFRSRRNTSQAVIEVKKMKNLCDEAKHFIEFVEASERGIIKE